ncbi:hypothetical protein B0H10DRAFT_2443392 [Mycena sp. CBHHK59/15]|nr:hypothetical protein B0H10DRAFT_2443392 [Mycena sp. CBHHK59/15]
MLGASQLFGLSQSQPKWSQSSQSQPLTDWSQSQSNFGDFGDDVFGFGPQYSAPPAQTGSQPTATPAPVTTAPSASNAVRGAVAASSQGVPPATPSVGVKRSASDRDDLQTSWSSKRGKVTGPDAILSLGKSVNGIGSALRDCFMPKESSSVSPTKQVAKARKIAEEDQEAGVINEEQRAILSLVFGSDPKTADAYVAEKIGFSSWFSSWFSFWFSRARDDFVTRRTPKTGFRESDQN